MSGCRPAVRLGAILLAVALLGACGAAATESPATPSPTPDADVAFMAAMDAIWSSPFDEAKVAALYAPNATLYDMVAGETANGLEEIKAKFKQYAALGFSTTSNTPIRQGDYIASFITFGTDAGTEAGLAVLQVRDGKVLNQWVYPAQ